MSKTNSYKKAKKEVVLRKQGGMPAWLYMLLSFVIPLYGIIYYVLLKDKDARRARIALFLALVGLGLLLLMRAFVWMG